MYCSPFQTYLRRGEKRSSIQPENRGMHSTQMGQKTIKTRQISLRIIDRDTRYKRCVCVSLFQCRRRRRRTSYYGHTAGREKVAVSRKRDLFCLANFLPPPHLSFPLEKGLRARDISPPFFLEEKNSKKRRIFAPFLFLARACAKAT